MKKLQILGYEERPERNVWCDNECETMIRSKNYTYKAWLSRPTHAKRI
jgi:hypothetical protein